jgi:predicted  nucleic acid-binding Zn-ribbon protein
MPYRCVHCSAIFDNGAKEIISGCSSCKSKFFFYIKDEKLKEIESMKEMENDLSSKEKKQIEKDVRDLVGVKDEEQPVFLDFESIKVLKPGKYLFDLQNLFAIDKPRVYKLEDGKYIIDLNIKSSPKKRV